jgi:hypothetical protein
MYLSQFQNLYHKSLQKDMQLCLLFAIHRTIILKPDLKFSGTVMSHVTALLGSWRFRPVSQIYLTFYSYQIMSCTYSFLWYWSLNSGPHVCWAGTLLLEPLLQPFFCVGYFWARVSQTVGWACLEPWSSWSLPTEIIITKSYPRQVNIKFSGNLEIMDK